jgi:hypothetical protein
MRVEEQFEGTLKDIETAIVQVFQRNREMTDYVVSRVLDAAAGQYKAIVREHALKPVQLTGVDLAAFEAVQQACESWLRGKGEHKALTAEEILQCIRRLQKSVSFWSREGGRQGYLNYVSRFIR